MKIGILQTGRTPENLREKHGDYNDMFIALLAGRGFEFISYPVLDDIFPEGVKAADGWLITGSRFSAYDNFKWIGRLMDFLREAYGQKIPIIGVCFGHQVLARALGGKVEKFTGGWSVGAKQYKSHDSAKNNRILAWHQDQIVKLPRGAKVTGSSDFCQYAMLSYGDNAISVQPHPEFNIEFLLDLVRERKDLLPVKIAREAMDSVGGGCPGSNKYRPGLTSSKMADQFEEFFKRSRIE